LRRTIARIARDHEPAEDELEALVLELLNSGNPIDAPGYPDQRCGHGADVILKRCATSVREDADRELNTC
jgi:hypothetical protein